MSQDKLKQYPHYKVPKRDVETTLRVLHTLEAALNKLPPLFPRLIVTSSVNETKALLVLLQIVNKSKSITESSIAEWYKLTKQRYEE